MTSQSIQAPMGGINSFDSVDDMPESDAVFLDNWIPDAGFCRVRGGSREFADLSATEIGTLVEYEYSTESLFIACADDKIIDITDGTPTTIGSGFTIPRWQTVVFNEKLLLVNGVDVPQEYDGTTLAPINFTGGIPSPSVLRGINVFKGRVFYWQNSSPVFIYANAGGYAGNVNSFDLSTVAKRGGVIVTMFTWSMDAGDGQDDFAVFLMSTGEAIVYQGDDPASATSWALVGKYKMGEPLAVRGNVSIAGDEIVLTKTGWDSFKHIIRYGEQGESNITRKMTGFSQRAASQYAGQTNWEAIFFPGGPYILINIPILDGNQYEQHVMNTNTGAWSTFSGWQSRTFGTYNQGLYFGGIDGKVYEADVGFNDAGDEILTDALPAFNYLSGRANNKQLTGIRIISTTSEPEKVALVATSDYQIPPTPETLPNTANATQTPWGSPWGSPYETTQGSTARGVWQSKNAFGYALSYRMAIAVKTEEVFWLSSQVMYKSGGTI